MNIHNKNIREMKKIEAIIRKSKFDEVKNALKEIGIDFFSYWDVRGVGKSRQERVYRGRQYDTSIIEREMLSIIVRDKNLKKTIDCILATAKTGEIGDGKIFVSNIDSAYRIRTGQEGDESLFIVGEEV
jgi:nitrogen regulatory protein P-II 1